MKSIDVCRHSSPVANLCAVGRPDLTAGSSTSERVRSLKNSSLYKGTFFLVVVVVVVPCVLSNYDPSC